MTIRPFVEQLYKKQVEELVSCESFKALESGRAKADDYDSFIANVIQTHLTSPQFLAFLFSIAPPAARSRIRHNMLEELGLEEEDGQSHPDMLRTLAESAGIHNRLPELEKLADDDLREAATRSLVYGTLKALGVSAMIEINAFEHMLSRVSSRMATFLEQHRSLPIEQLQWFTHHSEVDIQHAEQGFQSIDDFVEYYELQDHAETIAKKTLHENVFTKRYFGHDA